MKYGIHTPELTTETINKLKADFPALTFTDNAWNNDAADNVLVIGTKETDEVSIWIPNVDEGIPVFGISIRDNEGYTRNIDGVADESSDFATYEDLKAGLTRLLKGPEAEFFHKDKTGRGIAVTQTASNILEFCDNEDDDNGQMLYDFIKSAEIGDKWETVNESLTRVK